MVWTLVGKPAIPPMITWQNVLYVATLLRGGVQFKRLTNVYEMRGGFCRYSDDPIDPLTGGEKC